MGNNINFEQNKNIDLDILNKNRSIYRIKTLTANEIIKGIILMMLLIKKIIK